MMTPRGVKEFSAERQLRLRGLTGMPDSSSAELLPAIPELRNDIGELRRQIGAGDGPLAAGDAPEARGDNRECREARIEIAQMVRMLGRAKLEIASIKHPMAEDDRIKSAASELDAIVAATEASTQDILAAGEEIESLTRKIAGLHHGDEDVVTLTDRIAGEIIKIFEACNFQDITGQRVDKVVRTRGTFAGHDRHLGRGSLRRPAAAGSRGRKRRRGAHERTGIGQPRNQSGRD